jgi:chemotaxis protein MotB
LDVLAKDEQSEKFVTITVDAKKIRVVMEEPILFDSGDWRLKPKAKYFLHKLAQTLKGIPQQIVVEGHTDSIPMRSSRMMSNWELSAARASSVVDYLVKKENIPPERLSAVGYGQFKPVAPNDTPENRALNRRVEINILRIKPEE